MASERYSHLGPLDIEERGQICLSLCTFFNPLKNKQFREELGLEVREGQASPLSLGDYMRWAKERGNDLWPKLGHVVELTLKLEQNGILSDAGRSGRGLQLSKCFYFFYELSTLAQKGWLWLGGVLGAEFIGSQIKKDLALIIGKTPDGDIAVGTGLLILPGVVITCEHVLTDMKLDDHIEICGKQHAIESTTFSTKADVGVIALREKPAPAIADIAFRSARILEEIVIAGYPAIPKGLGPISTLHRGEIIGRLEETQDGFAMELFSAIARPGNSGGPVVGMDGRILGLVSRSLDRKGEEADSMAPLPFFSAVPADVIATEVRELTGLELPWESYQ